MPNDDQPIDRPDRLPVHESGVRRMMADATARPYRALQTLAEAQAAPDGVVVLEGDDGGQIYVVAPAREVRCSVEALGQLLADIDAEAWGDPRAARIYFERHDVGAVVAGGMGGGLVAAAVWVHPELGARRAAILDVLAGRRSRLDRGAR